MTKKLRLLIIRYCGRNCIGCCNKEWDLSALPIFENFGSFDEVILTGGEPMIVPETTRRWALKAKKDMKEMGKKGKVYLYTTLPTLDLIPLLRIIDGVCVTLHAPEFDTPTYRSILAEDISRLLYFDNILANMGEEFDDKSLRLNIFKGVDFDTTKLQNLWWVKKDMEWIKNCPLPEGETFGRIRFPEER